MKQLLLHLGFLLLLAACQQEVVPEEKGEKVALSFDLYKASLTKAEDTSNDDVSFMPTGKKFRAYAFPKGSETTDTPSGEGLYTVGDNGAASGSLTLYSGEYDIYLVSYFDKTYAPELDGSLISVDNGKDFMYTVLKDVTVRPASGATNMTVPVTTPFTRLCSNIILKVQASQTQPVPITGLKVKSITINNLSEPLSYQLGKSDWEKTNSIKYANSLTFDKFSIGTTVNDPAVGDPKVVLPINGSTALKFNLSLEITYKKTQLDNEITEIFPYEASVRKIFLPGMTYVFEFTLTFFGTISPTDLTLGILEYTTVSDNTDEVGK